MSEAEVASGAKRKLLRDAYSKRFLLTPRAYYRTHRNDIFVLFPAPKYCSRVKMLPRVPVLLVSLYFGQLLSF